MTSPPAFDPDAKLDRGVKLIEASAGTGKTYAITTLVLKLLVEEGLQITEILVVTFTEAATAELRDRVRERLRLALLAYEGSPPGSDAGVATFVERRVAAGEAAADIRALQQALQDFDLATISTIHGFCRRMLQENAFESGARFDAALVPDIGEMVDDVVADFWTRSMSDVDEDMYRFLTTAKSDEPHLQVTPESAGKLARQATSDRRLRVLPQTVERVERVADEEFAAATQQAASIWSADGEAVRALIEPAVDSRYFNKPLRDLVPACFACLDQWLESSPGAASFALQQSPALAISTSSLEEHKGKRKPAPLPVHPLFEALERVGELLRQHVAYLASEAVRLNLRLVEESREKLDERKRVLGIQTFDDLLELLRNALRHEATGPRLAATIRTQYKAALIDEFQDTSPTQFDVFSSIFIGDPLTVGDRPYLYLIGDPKQAIYGFRAADVYAYLRAAAAIDDENVLTLDTNWRTDDGLITALRFLYGRGRQPDPFGDERISFIDVASQHPRRLEPGKHSFAPLRVRVATEDAKQPAKKGEPARYGKGVLNDLMATCVPDDVVRMLNDGVEIDGHPLTPGDIAILVRANHQAVTLQGELRARGVPSVLHGSSSVFQTFEAEELDLVLRALLEPGRANVVRAALATDLVGVTATDLASLVEDTRGDAVAGERTWSEWVETFRSLRTAWDEHGFMRMFRQLMDELGVWGRTLGPLGGERAMTNLLHLSELLYRASKLEKLGPQGLHQWLRERAADEDGKKTDEFQLRLESDDQALTLVTIHKSKGLEYPVVFCPYLWDGALLRKADERYIRFHDPDDGERLTLDLGSDQEADGGKQGEETATLDGVPDARNLEGRARSLALAKHETQAENARLLYVALTRAKHHCTVYFAPVTDGETSPLGTLLLDQVDPASLPAAMADRSRERLRLAAEQIRRMGPSEVLAGVTALAEAAPDGSVEASPIISAPTPRYQPVTDAAAVLAAREFELSLDWRWRTTSYSGLIAGPHASPGPSWRDEAADAGADRDAVSAEDDAPVAPTEPGARVPLADFPKGARCGLCWHRILELADFAGLAKRQETEVIDAQLSAFNFDGRKWGAPIQSALAGAMETAIDDEDPTMTLAGVTRAQRLDELEFVFPVAGGLARDGTHVTAERLAGVFADHIGGAITPEYATALSGLSFQPLQGFLGGFIDLVFQWKERFYVVDYKSNFLGTSYDGYSQVDLQRAMEGHHYVLQYHLYAVALHRYLRWRVKGYTYEKHFGGARYLFLRGMSKETGTAAGVFSDRPNESLIHGLDQMLTGAT